MKLWFSVQVMVLGLLIVFVGLIILIGAIKLLSAILRRGEQAKAPAAPAVVQAVPAPAAPAEDDLALVAVMMAAILAGENVSGGKGLVVRSVRRLGGSAWSGAGRREQLGI